MSFESLDISAVTEALDISTEVDHADSDDTSGTIRFVAYTDSDKAIINTRAALASVIGGAYAGLLALTLEWDGPCPIVSIGFANLDSAAEFFHDGGTWRRHGLRLMSILRSMKGVYRVVEGSGSDGVYTDNETAIGVSGDAWDVVEYSESAVSDADDRDTDEPGGWISEGGWFFSDPA